MDTETSTKGGCCHGHDSLFTSGRVQRAVTFVLFMLAAFLLAATLNNFKEYRFIGSNIIPANVLSVSGEGEAFAVPDTAEFQFSITEERTTAGEVQKAVAEKADAVIAALKERGVEEKDIKTTSYDLQPKYEWVQERCAVGYGCPGKSVQNGFTLTQSVHVKVRNLDKAGELLGVVSEKGTSNVTGLSFTVADEDVLRADARKAAIDDAKAKADKLAQDLGVSIVRMVSFSEDRGYTPMPFYAAKDMAIAESADGGFDEAVVPAGENRITSNVTIIYEVR